MGASESFERIREICDKFENYQPNKGLKILNEALYQKRMTTMSKRRVALVDDFFDMFVAPHMEEIYQKAEQSLENQLQSKNQRQEQRQGQEPGQDQGQGQGQGQDQGQGQEKNESQDGAKGEEKGDNSGSGSGGKEEGEENGENQNFPSTGQFNLPDTDIYRPKLTEEKIKELLDKAESIRDLKKKAEENDISVNNLPDKDKDDEALSEALQILAKEDDKERIFVPNYDLETAFEKPLKQVYIEPNKETVIDRSSLVNANQFADSLIIKSMRSHNMKKYACKPPHFDDGCVICDELSKEIARGKNKNFYTTCVFVNDKANEKIGFAGIIYNKSNQNTIILADFDVCEEDREKLSKNGVFYVNVCEVDNKGDYGIISKFLTRQTLMSGDIKNGHLISSLMLRVDPKLAIDGADQGAEESVALELCNFVRNMNDAEKQNIDALQLTSVEYEPDVPFKAALNQKLKGR